MKDDRSWAEEERRQKARRYKGKLSLVISFSHTHTHVRVEKSTSWRTLAALTPLNIEQRGREGGERRHDRTSR